MWAIEDVFTIGNFEIAVTVGFIGYVVFEFLRKKFLAKLSLIWWPQSIQQ